MTNIKTNLAEITAKYGKWTFDIPLGNGIWTNGNLGLPHFRLKRILQTASDISNKPLNECRVLDLACLDGIFSIEFAQQGAEVVGIEIREANIKKAQFAGEVLGLNKLKFVQDDVRNISIEKYGEFDIIICSGILYHLTANDAFNLIKNMYQMSDLVIIDTHISLKPNKTVEHNNDIYHGHLYLEHHSDETPAQREKKLWASIDNETSFWFTRPSLINLLVKQGFSSVYEAFNPAQLVDDRIEFADRCTFVCLKSKEVELVTAPATNKKHNEFPQSSLQYGYEKSVVRPNFLERVLRKLSLI